MRQLSTHRIECGQIARDMAEPVLVTETSPLGYIQGPPVKLSLYMLEPGGSHMHLTGQNEVSLEPQSPHKHFEISHAQIGQS